MEEKILNALAILLKLQYISIQFDCIKYYLYFCYQTRTSKVLNIKLLLTSFVTFYVFLILYCINLCELNFYFLEWSEEW